MTPRFRQARFALAALAALATGNALAALTTYFGQDPSADLTVPAGGGSVTARSAFIDALDAGSVVKEGFETFSQGQTAPLALFGGSATITLNSGSGRIENRVTVNSESPGRFNTTTGCSSCNWWQASGPFTITFGQAVYAFGFYGTDFGDFGGSLSLDLLNADNSVAQSLAVSPSAGTNGSLLFFGFANNTRAYSSIRFNITQCVPGSTSTCSGSDVLGFDDLVIGKLAAPSNSVPEPATLALAGLSLAALAAIRRKPRR
jgi:hypothetical protein